jgi:hypothetical protein
MRHDRVAEDDGNTTMTTKESANDAGALLSVVAALLLDNVSSLDKTVGEVTDLVVGNGQPSREMIVTLQSFDRLKQEFEALGQALERYAEVAGKSESGNLALDVVEERVVAEITVADLRDRFLNLLKEGVPEIVLPQISEQELACIGIDVVY